MVSGRPRYRGLGFRADPRDRQPKPALAAVKLAFQEIPFPKRQWPKISVIVCSYNGAKTIDETLTAIERLTYPAYETIVVDDGSSDDTSFIVKKHKVHSEIECASQQSRQC